MRRPAKGNNFMAFTMISGFVIAYFILFIMKELSTTGKFTFDYGTGFLLIITQLSSFAIPIIIYFFITKDKFTELIPVKGIGLIDAVQIIFMTICIIPLSTFISSISIIFFENTTGESITELYNFPFWVPVLLVCVMPAVFEELALRGVILGNYANVPIKKAAIMNGFLFGIMHLNFFQFFYAFVLGYVFAYFVYYTGTIFASIIAHFTFNFASTAMSYGYYKTIKDSPEQLAIYLNADYTSSEIMLNILNSAIVAIMFTPIFLLLFKSFISHKKWEKLEKEIKATTDEDYDIEMEEDIPLNVIKYYEIDNTTVNLGIENQESMEGNIVTEIHNKEQKIFTVGFWVSLIIFIIVVSLSAIAIIITNMAMPELSVEYIEPLKSIDKFFI